MLKGAITTLKPLLVSATYDLVIIANENTTNVKGPPSTVHVSNYITIVIVGSLAVFQQGAVLQNKIPKLCNLTWTTIVCILSH